MPRNELLIDIRVNVLGMTQRELARAVGVSPRTVRGWEIGATVRPQAALLTQLMRVTGVGSATELGFGPSPLCGPRSTVFVAGIGQKGSTDVLRRRELLMIVSGALGGTMAEPVTRLFPAPKDRARIGASDVEQVKSLRLHAHEFERMLGGGAVNGATVVRRFRAALDMLHGTFRDDAVRQDMHAAVAHFGCTAGWILVDHGDHGAAQRMFGAALAAVDGAPAERSGPLRALILTDMSRQAIYQGHYRTAVELLDFLDAELLTLPDDARAIVHSRRARALAGLGDVHTVDELSRRASGELGACSVDTAAELRDIALGGLELTSDLGHAFSSLAVEHGIRSAEAERRLVESITSYGPGDSRSRALAGMQLVNVHLAQRDSQRALAVAQAHAAEADLIRSDHLRHTADTGLRLTARHRSDPGIAEVTDILRNIRRPIDVRAQTA